MKIEAYKQIQDCLQGKNVWDLYFDKFINEQFVASLGKLGKIVVQNFKTKPFFTLIVRGKYTIKGSIGNRSARLILPDEAEKKIPDELITFIEKIQS